jgi:hypothetical protein
MDDEKHFQNGELDRTHYYGSNLYDNQPDYKVFLGSPAPVFRRTADPMQA